MASQVNSIKHLDLIPILLKLFLKSSRGRGHLQTDSTWPPSPWYQNQTKISHTKKKSQAKITDDGGQVESVCEWPLPLELFRKSLRRIGIRSKCLIEFTCEAMYHWLLFLEDFCNSLFQFQYLIFCSYALFLSGSLLEGCSFPRSFPLLPRLSILFAYSSLQ